MNKNQRKKERENFFLLDFPFSNKNDVKTRALTDTSCQKGFSYQARTVMSIIEYWRWNQCQNKGKQEKCSLRVFFFIFDWERSFNSFHLSPLKKTIFQSKLFFTLDGPNSLKRCFHLQNVFQRIFFIVVRKSTDHDNISLWYSVSFQARKCSV